MIKKTLSLLLSTTLILAPAAKSFADDGISFEDVSKDVSYLASDALKGRASFSPEIDQAGDYIAKRFAQNGLVSASNTTQFKQKFAIYRLTPSQLNITLNGKTIAEQDMSMASTVATLSWQQSSPITQHIIGENDDMRTTLRAINQQGGQHFIVINKKHKKMFAGYKTYFKRGLSKLSLDHQGAIVIVLSNDNKIEQLSVEGKTDISKRSLTNVVGMLKGKTLPDEIVLFSSHYDHLGLSDKEGQDQIFNGADDDASGTAAIINIANYYAKKADNARTLVFAAFTAEEIGGFGSRYFSQQLNPDTITAMINVEMVGKPSKFGVGTLWMTGMERSNLGKLLNDNIKDKGIEIYKDPYPEQGLFYRSDNATLARLGVPAHSFSSTQLDKDQHYHQVSDDIASLDLHSLHQVVQTLAKATQGLVDGSVTPSRIDINKVKGQGLIY